MKMNFRDVLGTLYSAGGIRFGGFQTLEFLELTEPLEEKRPGIREEIIAESYYLVMWKHDICEVGFYFGIALYTSLKIASLFLILTFIIEVIRFCLFGSSMTISYSCKVWEWVRLPIFTITSVILWPKGHFLPILRKSWQNAPTFSRR